jgi:transcriptional regulator with XRE-family HTH domain
MLWVVSSLKDRLDGLRRAKGWSWEGLAKAAGVKRQTLYKAFEREDAGGLHNMDGKTIHGLARALGRSTEWVSVGSGEVTQQTVIDLRPVIFAVVDAVAEDMRIPKDQAAAIVGRYAFASEHGHKWRGELDLYRIVMRETTSMRPPSSVPAGLPVAASGGGGGVRRKLAKKR